ncbi:hypothetical protein ES332_D07G172500v1 [Gossypium tomentosum]|uniref:Uncharacterized protein n=1 Tax=Gossypium tomentosum TaxID=34277 RepID=A0A5D2K7S7_GOSTO|nr:hypothetical protein ES332_D07G172500v1 [Gossypium tomentosum]
MKYPLIPSQIVLHHHHLHRIKYTINPAPTYPSSPTFQRQNMSCLINRTRHKTVSYLIKKHIQLMNMISNRSENRFICLLFSDIFDDRKRITFHSQPLKAHLTRED